ERRMRLLERLWSHVGRGGVEEAAVGIAGPLGGGLHHTLHRFLPNLPLFTDAAAGRGPIAGPPPVRPAQAQAPAAIQNQSRPTRPTETRSRVDTGSATRIGWLVGSWMIP